MKIAIYSGNIPSTTFIENLIDGLSQAGYEILLFGKLLKKVEARKNVKLIPTPVKNIPLILFVSKQSLLLLLKEPGLLFRSLKTFKKKSGSIKSFLQKAGVLLPVFNNMPDVFHIQWAKTVEQHPELFSLTDMKIALSLRGAHINYSPLADNDLAEAYKKYFPEIRAFHAVSKAIGDEAEKYGADKKKIKVIYTSVKEDLLQKSPKLYEGGNLEIISVGRFHWKKGYHYAIDAMKILRDEGLNFNYTIIAQGEIPEEIIFLIDEYQLYDKVKIVQGMSYEELISKLLSSHLLLLPSVEEGIANVVLEAMASGVPVITTDCGGMKEAVEDNINGYVVSIREPDQIAEKIRVFIRSEKDVKEKITAKARETVIEKFSRPRQVMEFSEFYDSIVRQ
ncbi:MAG: glycosyltransferase family 4 protein [Ignavibacteria bacterium]